MEETGVISIYNNYTVFEWYLSSFSDLPRGNRRIWSTTFGRCRGLMQNSPCTYCFGPFQCGPISIFLRSKEGGQHPSKVIIGAVEKGVGYYEEDQQKTIVSGIAEWAPTYDGFIATFFLLAHKVHPRRFDGENFVGNMQLFCELVQEQNPDPNTVPCPVCNNSQCNCTEVKDEDTEDPKSRSIIFKDLKISAKRLLQFYMNDGDCDLTIKVKGEEIQVHSAILRARSPVFELMLSHNFMKRNGRVITIDDFDPDVFHLFLMYIYSGKIVQITFNEAYDLYVAADMYCVPMLKPICIHYLKQTLSVEKVIETYCLANIFDEDNLKTYALHVFGKNHEEVMQSAGYKTFSNRDPIFAEEILTQALSWAK